MMSQRQSSASSRGGAFAREEIKYEELSDEQLRLALEEATRTSRTLTLENEVFERYLLRRDPESLRKLSYIVESARQAQKIAQLRTIQADVRASHASSTLSLTGSQSTLASGQHSGSQHLSIGGGAGLPKQSIKGLKPTINHRIELADKEMDDMKKQYETFEKSITRKKESLVARLEEIKQRTVEINAALEQFDAQVLCKADPVSKKVPVEKFVRFLEEQLRVAGAASDKLNLKIVTANRLIRQTKKQILQRSEMGNTLRPVDFEKLKIENELLIGETEKNNKQLKMLKLIGAHYNLSLKYHKDELLQRKSALETLEKTLSVKKHENSNLRRKQARTRREVIKGQNQLNRYKELQDKYVVPESLDFLNVEKQLQDAKKSLKVLCRQRNLQLFAIKSKRQN